MSPEVPATGAPAAGTELEALGRRLAEARLSRGLDLDVLADQLHLGKEQLAALENADLSRLPEPVFVIAQAKRVAGVLGIDLTPQLQALRQSRWLQQASPRPVAAPVAAPVTRLAAAAPGETAAAARAAEQGPSRLPLAATAALAMLLTAIWGVRQWQSSSAVRRAPQAAQTTQADPATEPAAGKPSSPADIPTPRPAVTAGTLVLQSTQPSWVEVRDSSGSTLFRGTLTGEKRFPLGTGLQVLAGRPDLVTAAIGPQPGQRLGPISDVRWRNLGP